MQRKQRNSGIELLRIVAMILIIAHHFALHTNWPDVGFTPNAYLIDALQSFGKVGVGIFFIISGYFLQKKTPSNIKQHIARILRPTYFYALLFLAIALIFGKIVFRIEIPMSSEIMESLIPITSHSYWFIGSFILLELFSPIIKKATEALSNGEILFLIAAYVIFGWEFGSFFYFAANNYNPLITIPAFLVYVLIGILIARTEKSISTRKLIIASISCIIALLLAPFITRNLPLHYSNNSLFWINDSPICMILSASLVLLFNRIKKSSKVINYIAGLTLGVYLIHDNFFVRYWLWKGGKLNVSSHIYDSGPTFIVYAAIIILGLFIGCAVVEMIRKTASNFLAKIIVKYRQ